MSISDELRATEREYAIQGELFRYSTDVKEPDSLNTTSNNPDSKDRTLICPDCQREFRCTIEELEQYEELGCVRPIRCPTCHLAKYVKRSRNKR
jgi:hypothetical protein